MVPKPNRAVLGRTMSPFTSRLKLFCGATLATKCATTTKAINYERLSKEDRNAREKWDYDQWDSKS
jgi:hypothetical protein